MGDWSHSCLLAAVLVLSASCTGTVGPRPDRDARPVWPAHPDEPRFVYETTLRTAGDISVDDQTQRLKRLVTGPRDPEKPAVAKPVDVVARRGRIYVSDGEERHIVVFDVPRRKVFRFGHREPGRLVKPVGMALDGNMNVYVADATRRAVMVFDSLGLFLREIGAPGDFERPTGVTVTRTGDRIYVVDRSTNESDNHRVVAFDGQGQRLFQIGTRGGGDGQFNLPLHAGVAPNGNLYVLDAGNFRVQVFDPEGRFLRSFGEVGTGFGNFARPRGLTVDDEGRIYVTDATFGNFQIFDPEGRLLLAIGERSRADGPGRYSLPSGISVDETGRIYVVDQFFNKVEVIRPVAARRAGHGATPTAAL